MLLMLVTHTNLHLSLVSSVKVVRRLEHLRFCSVDVGCQMEEDWDGKEHVI